LIDVERSVSKAKKLKNAIIASRFHRILQAKGKKPKETLRNISGKIKHSFDRAMDRLLEIEAKTEKAAIAKSAGITTEKEKPAIKAAKGESRILELLEEALRLTRGGNWKQAEGKYIEVIKVDSKNIPAYQGLTRLYLDNNKNAEARQILEFLLKLGVEDADTYINFANLAWEEDSLDEAKIYYLKALSLDGSKVIARVNLGLVFSELGDKEAAMQQFRAAFELEPKNPRYLDLLLESSIQIGDKDLAKKALQNLKEVNPENQKIDDFKKRINEM
jgi:tetratricopeptide (TPR) repeat protein